jgi:protein-L-isoaspartate(D-aspartate) O-methyltransferase
MIADQLVRRGIVDERVLAAFAKVPRDLFVSEKLSELAYEDFPLPIGDEQTISQPFVVALTCAALRLEGTERVLEIGTGSGYSTAILAELAREVFSVERIERLAQAAAFRLARLGVANAHVTCADGSLGLREHAPYDAIAVAAAAPDVPRALREQLAQRGRLVMPVGGATGQRLVRVTRESAASWREEDLGAVAFVPLIGEDAWRPEEMHAARRVNRQRP